MRAGLEAPLSIFHHDSFQTRHIGPNKADIAQMLSRLGFQSLDQLLDAVVPEKIRLDGNLNLPPALSEHQSLATLRDTAQKNQVWRSYIGTGYYDTLTPPVIRRNLLENPGWYTAYTPYQAEISQGRLEALLNFQTMISELTGLDCANASMLDEGTAAAEAMTMCKRILKRRKGANRFLVDSGCHPQTIEIVKTRAKPLGYDVIVEKPEKWSFEEPVFGILLQYPATDGEINDHGPLIQAAHNHGAMAIISADPLALTLLKTPSELGADIAIGSTQRFGVPMGFGGPHAAYLATNTEHVRQLPGRVIGVSIDADGNRALRMSLQTREQHIRRHKATSNICTSQVLLAVIASMYAVYHGPDGLTKIAKTIRAKTNTLKAGLRTTEFPVGPENSFDTIWVKTGDKTSEIINKAQRKKINLRDFGDGRVGVSLDQTVSETDLVDLLDIFGIKPDLSKLSANADEPLPAELQRTSPALKHAVFSAHHSETGLMRYMRALQGKDLALDTAMIPLGSCTMKLNAAAEMIPITWPEFSAIHPFVPVDQAAGYIEMIEQMERWLAEITGFDAVSFQPNAGSQGEYTGLLLIRGWHASRGDAHRNVCLIPSSAHGTNPASAVMAGMKVVVVKCRDNGDIDTDDLRKSAEKHSENLAALMVTYPSTHGVFESGIGDICDLIHEHGGQVYLDGANMNAMVGIVKPGLFGADVAHLNLHKTFAIPHGGGGPGVGPVCIKEHLVPFLPQNPIVSVPSEQSIGTISSALHGSAGVLPISWSYIAMLGPTGLTQSSAVAILSANYIAAELSDDYCVLYTGENGLVAHECILDLNPLKSASVTAEDVAKRLMDYGFHAPTMSWPVVGTLMVEPTESEPKAELDRFIEAMRSIRQEVRDIESGESDAVDNPLKGAPHTVASVTVDEWNHSYSRQIAAFPTVHTRMRKYWPTVRRVDNVFGDKNLVCACPPLSAYED